MPQQKQQLLPDTNNTERLLMMMHSMVNPNRIDSTNRAINEKAHNNDSFSHHQTLIPHHHNNAIVQKQQQWYHSHPNQHQHTIVGSLNTINNNHDIIVQNRTCSTTTNSNTNSNEGKPTATCSKQGQVILGIRNNSEVQEKGEDIGDFFGRDVSNSSSSSSSLSVESCGGGASSPHKTNNISNQQHEETTTTAAASVTNFDENEDEEDICDDGGGLEDNLYPISCIACRRGHKKCGRQLPVCEECKLRGKCCQYPQPKKRGRTVGSKNKNPKKKNVTMTIMGLDSFEKKKTGNGNGGAGGYSIVLSHTDTQSIQESQQFSIQQPNQESPQPNKRNGSYENFQITTVKKKKVDKSNQSKASTKQPNPVTSKNSSNNKDDSNTTNISVNTQLPSNKEMSQLNNNTTGIPLSLPSIPNNISFSTAQRQQHVNTQQQNSIYYQQPPYRQVSFNNNENSPTAGEMKNTQLLDLEGIMNLVRHALSTNCDQNVIDTLLGLIVQTGNASTVMPIIAHLINNNNGSYNNNNNNTISSHDLNNNTQQVSTTTTATSTAYGSPHNGSNNDVRDSLSTIPQVIDEAVYSTFEKNTLLLPTILQQQTIELFFGMVSAGVPIVTRDTFNKIINSRESYGTTNHYTSLLYSIQSFCFQRAGNNTNSIRAFYRGKELLVSDYNYSVKPSYLIASICCYLGSYAAASYMNDEAASLLEITAKYLSTVQTASQQSALDESIMCLKRGYQLALIIMGDLDNEELNIPNYLQRKLSEGYRYSSSQPVIPVNLNNILKNPVSHNNVPDYLQFVDAIEREFNIYHSKKNITEKGRALGNLLISLSVSSYRLLIYRDLGYRGRSLKQAAYSLTNLFKHPLFPHIPAFLLSGLSKSWRSHVEAVEEIENDFFKGIPIDVQEFAYYHGMLAVDLQAANVIGKRFTKVFNAFGKIVQRMIDCTKRRDLILSKLKQQQQSSSQQPQQHLELKLNLDLNFH